MYVIISVFVFPLETTIVLALLTLIMLWRFWADILNIVHGTQEKKNIPKKIIQLLTKKKDSAKSAK
ncbi:hypothetical protein [Schleiferilactobacillus harbinensis]|uniref:hypothetical protein n=1 Tax=Schleiferilactobacillus harbinensis TaxID=304207 RepID=UPI0009E61CFE|nr:hypothetical protein [Schleiferilactobacillus harbinensis]